MPLTLDSWSLDGSQLIEAITLDQARTSGTELVLTTAIVEELRLAHWSKVRDTIEGTRELARSVKIIKKRDRGGDSPTSVPFNLDRQERALAFAGFLTMQKQNLEPCAQCANTDKSRGPCEECVAGGPSHFSGACCNCKYSGQVPQCSFAKELKKAKEAAEHAAIRKRRLLNDELDYALIIRDSDIREMPQGDLEATIKRLQAEVARRDGLASSFKRPRHC